MAANSAFALYRVRGASLLSAYPDMDSREYEGARGEGSDNRISRASQRNVFNRFATQNITGLSS